MSHLIFAVRWSKKPRAPLIHQRKWQQAFTWQFKAQFWLGLCWAGPQVGKAGRKPVEMAGHTSHGMAENFEEQHCWKTWEDAGSWRTAGVAGLVVRSPSAVHVAPSARDCRLNLRIFAIDFTMFCRPVALDHLGIIIITIMSPKWGNWGTKSLYHAHYLLEVLFFTHLLL